MATVPIFHGAIDADGTFRLADNEKALRLRYFQLLAGERVEIIVRKERTQRSLAQNNFIHLAASLLADHTGYTLAEMKLLLMGACWGWHTVGVHELPVKPHTSDMSVTEAKQFIDWLIPWAAEHFPEVDVPLPEKATAA